MPAADLLASLQAEVTSITTVAASATALINGFAARQQAAVDAAIANGATAEQLAPVQAEIDAMKAADTALGAAVAAGTPAAPAAPAA